MQESTMCGPVYNFYNNCACEGKEVYFSLEERKCGTWIDGKTLYQKTYHMKTADAVDISDINFDFVKIADAVFYIVFADTNELFSVPIENDQKNLEDHYISFININTKQLCFDMGTKDIIHDIYITLQYTKKTV